MKKILLIIILVMGLANLVSAGSYENPDDYFKLGDNINFEKGCYLNEGICPVTALCNLTVIRQNNTVLIDNKAMTNRGMHYNYTFPVLTDCTKDCGVYKADMTCIYDGVNASKTFYIRVNSQGRSYNTNDGLIYIISLIVLIITFCFSLYGSLAINGENEKNADNEVLRINKKKYLKQFLFAISYVTMVALFFFAWNITSGILEFDSMGKFFYFLFRVSFIMILPTIILIFVFAMIKFVHDRKIEEMIKRGLTARDD